MFVKKKRRKKGENGETDAYRRRNREAKSQEKKNISRQPTQCFRGYRLYPLIESKEPDKCEIKDKYQNLHARQT